MQDIRRGYTVLSVVPIQLLAGTCVTVFISIYQGKYVLFIQVVCVSDVEFYRALSLYNNVVMYNVFNNFVTKLSSFVDVKESS